MTEKIKGLYGKYKEIIRYIFFGVLTTAVDFVSYLILTRLLKLNDDAANVIAQIIAIVFAFVTNKLYVFEDRAAGFRRLAVQFLKFASARVFTLILNSVMFHVLNEYAGMHDVIAKAVTSVVVIILNYVFSKLFVFKKRKDSDNESSGL